VVARCVLVLFASALGWAWVVASVAAWGCVAWSLFISFVLITIRFCYVVFHRAEGGGPPDQTRWCLDFA